MNWAGFLKWLSPFVTDFMRLIPRPSRYSVFVCLMTILLTVAWRFVLYLLFRRKSRASRVNRQFGLRLEIIIISALLCWVFRWCNVSRNFNEKREEASDSNHLAEFLHQLWKRTYNSVTKVESTENGHGSKRVLAQDCHKIGVKSGKASRFLHSSSNALSRWSAFASCNINGCSSLTSFAITELSDVEWLQSGSEPCKASLECLTTAE